MKSSKKPGSDYTLLKKTVALLHYYGVKLLDNFIFYTGKMAGRVIFPAILIKNPKLYISYPSYYPECKLKGRLQIFFEQLLYILRTGEVNKHYFDFGFDRVSKNDFRDYVPWLTFTHARNIKNQLPVKPDYDPYNYVCLLRDKFVFEAFCKGTGIKTPVNIGMINNSSFYLIKESKFFHLEEITNFELDAFCKREVSFGGGKPRDVIKLRILGKEIFMNDTKKTYTEFKKFLGNDKWIIQERIRNQAPEYALLHPDSINTIRIITINTGLEIEILCAKLRIGVNGSYTDNGSSGGIGVNIEHGSLVKWGFYKVGLGTKCDRHPNSNVLFDGYKLPYWEEIEQFVKKAHRLFYGLHSIGWDVAVTKEGIMLIEGNDNWDTVTPQLFKGAIMEFNKYFR